MISTSYLVDITQGKQEYYSMCSCDVDLCYVNEAIQFDENEWSVVTDFHIKLTSGQNTNLGNFRQIDCSKEENELCEVDLYIVNVPE